MTTLASRRFLIALSLLAAGAAGQERRPLPLPAPGMSGGLPLMQALKERKSSREFDKRELPLQVLSDLLWAAHGINRPDSGCRTAPSAHNWQEIDVYIAFSDGAFRYVPKEHHLVPIVPEDIRVLTGTQDFVAEAPLNLVYVADFSKMGNEPETEKSIYAAADTGFIAQNVYLYCASAGLATVVRAGVQREMLAKRLGLRADQRITLAQSVGYPKR